MIKINDTVWIIWTPDIESDKKTILTDQDLKDMMGVVAVTPTGIISYTKRKKNEKS
jgi:hypothetical protein